MPQNYNILLHMIPIHKNLCDMIKGNTAITGLPIHCKQLFYFIE
jgi:hypothetical protein